MKLEFNVSILGGDASVEVNVSKKEYKLLKECCADGEAIEEYEGLEDLCEKIAAALQEQNEDFDPDSADYSIEMPEEICEAVEEE